MSITEHLRLGGNPLSSDSDAQLAQQNILQKLSRDQQLEAYNVSRSCFPPAEMISVAPSPLDVCLKYFRARGLTDAQIRVAITPVLFDELRKLEDGIE